MADVAAHLAGFHLRRGRRRRDHRLGGPIPALAQPRARRALPDPVCRNVEVSPRATRRCAQCAPRRVSRLRPGHAGACVGAIRRSCLISQKCLFCLPEALMTKSRQARAATLARRATLTQLIEEKVQRLDIPALVRLATELDIA